MKSWKKNKRKPARTASQKFDRQLFTLKRLELSREMRGKSVDAERQLRAESRELADPFSLKMQNVVDGQLAVLSECLEGVDRICREVWQIQREAVTPDFVRGVLVPEAMKLIAAQEAAVKSNVRGFARVPGVAKDPSPALRHLAMEVKRLQAQVNEKYEIEARELEHVQEPTKAVEDAVAGNSGRPAQDAEGKSTNVAGNLSLPKMSSGPNAFEISEIQD